MFSFFGEGLGDVLCMCGVGEYVFLDDFDMECDIGLIDIFFRDFVGNVWDILGVLVWWVGVFWDWGIGVFLWFV